MKFVYGAVAPYRFYASNINVIVMRIGWIGTGVIGGSCAKRLLEAGYPLVVTTRSPNKAQPLLDAGAQWSDAPDDVATQSDVVFSCVGYPRDVREIFFGGDYFIIVFGDIIPNRDSFLLIFKYRI